MTLVLIFIATLFVAYANGANDNFKGVATLYASQLVSYRQAITLATVATFAGCVASLFLADELVRAFSGKGLVPNAVAASPDFLLAVAIGAGSTVILATLLAFPISTTHGLTGALVGAGAMAAGRELNLDALGTTFLLPLLLSPLIAALLAVVAYRLLGSATTRLGLRRDSCACIGDDATAVIASPVRVPVMALQRGAVTVSIDSTEACATRYPGQMWGVSAQRLLTASHIASAGAVSFARGLNDTPKIVALMLVIQALDVRLGMLAVALAMAAGGLLNARKVAHTMSRRIATMSDGPAFAANLVSGLLVIAASRYGLPVSTTHVCVGAITGIGVTNGSANAPLLRQIALSWVLTLPIAAVLSASTWWLLAHIA